MPCLDGADVQGGNMSSTLMSAHRSSHAQGTLPPSQDLVASWPATSDADISSCQEGAARVLGVVGELGPADFRGFREMLRGVVPSSSGGRDPIDGDVH